MAFFGLTKRDFRRIFLGVIIALILGIGIAIYLPAYYAWYLPGAIYIVVYLLLLYFKVRV